MFSTPWRWLSRLIPSSPRAAERDPFQPRVEDLEVRAVPAMTSNMHPNIDAILFTRLQEGDPLAMHIHPKLTIIIDGKKQLIPAGIGIAADGSHDAIHTHTPDGIIHIESPVAATFRLGMFFEIWGKEFNRHDILGHHTDRNHKITVTVNGVPNNQFQNLILTADQGPQTSSQGGATNPPGIVIDYEPIHPRK